MDLSNLRRFEETLGELADAQPPYSPDIVRRLHRRVQALEGELVESRLSRAARHWMRMNDNLRWERDHWQRGARRYKTRYKVTLGILVLSWLGLLTIFFS